MERGGRSEDEIRRERARLATEQLADQVELRAAAAGEESPPPEPAELADGLVRGARLGRFVVDARLGSGGMGVVVAAHDPTLERRVAIKLLRADVWSVDGEASQRLLREAQAMARLSHPHVVTVYEVGTTGDRAFVAMELVDGMTLRAWLADRERSWREIVEVFRQAGAGLAAAHDAGMVHRDFKPENVLIGRDGRARVTDFGLVGANPTAAPPADAVDAHALTHIGPAMGTPAYMAPEQHRGEPTSAATDQFAFCVALYEGLYGHRPFAGDTLRELAEAATEHRVRAAPATSEVPARLRALMLRGLAREPAERHPSMHALLAGLAEDRRRGGRAVVAAAVALAVVGIGGGLWIASRDAAAAKCTGGERRLAGVWDPAIKARVRTGFLATGQPFAPRAADEVARILDERATSWVGMYREACEATNVRGDQSPELLDLRMACLDDRLAQQGSLAAVLADAPDDHVVQTATGAASRLEPIADCADVVALRRKTPLPADPALRARLVELKRHADQAQALADVGKYRDSAAVATAMIPEAISIGWPPAHATALHLLGNAQKLGGDHAAAIVTFEQLSHVAATAKDDTRLGLAFVEIAEGLGDRGKLDEAASRLRLAEASAERADSTSLDILLDAAIGRNAMARGDFAEARARLERALSRSEAAYGPDSPQLIVGFDNLGSVYADLQLYPEARAAHERAVRISEATLGTEHPLSAQVLHNLAVITEQMGDPFGAMPMYERSLAVAERTLGPDSLILAGLLGDVGGSRLGVGDLAGARRDIERSLAIKRKHLPPIADTIAGTVDNLGIVAMREGKLDEALRLHEEALATRIAALGEGHHAVGGTLDNVATAQCKKGLVDKAVASYRRAVAIYRKAMGDAHPDIALILTNLGGCLLDSRRAAAAIEPLEQAITIHEAADTPPTTLADTRFAAARALWDARRDRTRARQLAEIARDAYRDGGEGFAPRLAAVEAWLTAHPAAR